MPAPMEGVIDPSPGGRTLGEKTGYIIGLGLAHRENASTAGRHSSDRQARFATYVQWTRAGILPSWAIWFDPLLC